MIRFKIDDVDYLINDVISIEDYVKIFKIKDISDDNYFAAKILSIVSEAPYQTLIECEYQDIETLAEYVMSLIPRDNPPLIDRIEIDGVKYGFLPNWKDMTFAEFVDLDTISNKPQKELLDLLHIIAAILYRPITEERSRHNYDIEPYDVDEMKRRAEIFKKKMNIHILLGAQFFFINYAKKYSNYIQSYSTLTLSRWEKIKMIWMMWRMVLKMRSKKHSVGTWFLTEYHKMILQSMTQSSRKN